MVRKRLRAVRPKIVKLKRLRRVGVRTHRLAAATVNAAVVYGAECVGASSTLIRRAATLAHTSVMEKIRGRSATFDLLLAKGASRVLHPGLRLAIGRIMSLAAALWDNWLPREYILRSWNVAFQLASSASFSWNLVTDPIAAAAASLRRIGWDSPAAGKLETRSKVSVDLLRMCPRSVARLLEDDAEAWILRQSFFRNSV